MECEKIDGTTCDKCKKNHHRSLHNERKIADPPTLDPRAPPFQRPNDGTVNNTADTYVTKQKLDIKTVAGLLPVQKVKVEDSNGEPIEMLAMLDTGSNSSLLSKAAAKKLGLRGPQTHLTMNLAGGSTRSETSEIIKIILVSPKDKTSEKLF